MDDPENGHYAPWDGPAAMQPVRDPATGQLVTPQMSVRDRAAAVADLDKQAAEDIILQNLHQFILAKTPVDVICQRMNISMGSYKWLRKKLAIRMREAAKAKDPLDFLGPIIAEMEEARATAWREVALSGSSAKNWNRRMRAVEVVLRSNMDLARLLQVAGLFDNSPMRAPLAQDDEDSGGANALKEMSLRFLQGGYQDKGLLSAGAVLSGDD